MTTDVLAELEGLRALARSLVHGDAEAEDLVQDAALAALEHPPATDRPVAPWLVTVIKNRWRMNRRGEARRRAREQLAEVVDAPADDPIDRARVLQRLGDALVALDEPLRAVVVRRYLDGQTSSEIARALGVPPGTVRWQLKAGLERLRAALDAHDPRARWQRALAPLGALVKTKAKLALGSAVIAVLLLLAGVWLAVGQRGGGATSTPPGALAGRGSAARLAPIAPGGAAIAIAPHAEPSRGQGRATLALVDGAGAAAGHVVNWSSGEGVAGAELTFTGDAGALTVRSGEGGGFELAPTAPGTYVLTAIAAPGFLPYAPEYLHSSVRVDIARGHAVRGITVFLFPALDYHGRVVHAGKPVANAHVKLLGTPAGEQMIDKLATEWTTDADGRFTFHAADDAVLEAHAGALRGSARLDGNVAITKQLVIELGNEPAHDQTISGRVTGEDGQPIADVLVRAEPDPAASTKVRATAFAVTAADGAFELRELDALSYTLAAETEGRAPITRRGVAGGTHDVVLVMSAGAQLAGKVVTSSGDPVPSFTLLVFRRAGVVRDLVVAKSFVAASGAFDVRVEPGAYELLASASGWAPSPVTLATAPAKDVALAVSAGATLAGVIVSSADGHPVPYARVMREARGGGASAQPANAGTVSRDDGSFELAGIPAGPLSITIDADGFHPRIEGGLSATDGAQLGPITLALTPLAPGEEPKIELVGIGVKLVGDGDALRVDLVVPDSGAAAAGIVAGDHIVAVGGVPVTDLGVDGAVAMIRGAAGTTIAISLARDGQVVTLQVERRKLEA